MDVDTFWALVDASRVRHDAEDHEASVDQQLTALREELAGLPDREVIAFEQHLRLLTASANSWRLWAAGYLAAGGMSDDAFDDFRLWLVLQGRSAFDQVLADPDALASLGWEPHGTSFSMGEELGYLVTEVLEERDADLSEALAVDRAAGQPDGTPFDEDDDDWFAATFPRLWARARSAQPAARDRSTTPAATAPQQRVQASTSPPLRLRKAIRPLPPLLAAELFERGHISPSERPMVAAHWLAEDRGGEAVLELASLRGHEPEVGELWPLALAEMGVQLPVPTPRVAMAWAAQRVLEGERDLHWLVQMLWMPFDAAEEQDDFQRLVLSVDHVLDWSDRDLGSRRPEVRQRAEAARTAVRTAIEAMARDDVAGALGALERL